MGTRYFLTVVCECGNKMEDVYYAPTCGFITTTCTECGKIIDLEAYSGISYEEASNLDEIQAIADSYFENPEEFIDIDDLELMDEEYPDETYTEDITD